MDLKAREDLFEAVREIFSIWLLLVSLNNYQRPALLIFSNVFTNFNFSLPVLFGKNAKKRTRQFWLSKLFCFTASYKTVPNDLRSTALENIGVGEPIRANCEKGTQQPCCYNP